MRSETCHCCRYKYKRGFPRIANSTGQHMLNQHSKKVAKIPSYRCWTPGYPKPQVPGNKEGDMLKSVIHTIGLLIEQFSTQPFWFIGSTYLSFRRRPSLGQLTGFQQSSGGRQRQSGIETTSYC